MKYSDNNNNSNFNSLPSGGGPGRGCPNSDNNSNLNSLPSGGGSGRGCIRFPYLTFLSRNKGYTLITLFGFSVSLMFVILIGLHTQQEYGTDQWQSKKDNIYLLATENKQGDVWAGTNRGLGTQMKNNYPDVRRTCSVAYFEDMRTNLLNGEAIRQKVLFADPTFYDFFDFPLVSGNRHHVLDGGDAAVISPELARKLFDDADPVGKTLTFNDSLKLRITGVFAPMKATSFKNVDVIVSFDYLKHINSNMTSEQMNSFGGTDVFLMTRNGVDLRKQEKAVTDNFKNYIWFFQDTTSAPQVRFIPYSKMYLSKSDSQVTDRADTKLLNILFTVGLIVLLFAVINYINLTVAQAVKRAREMATRRLFGAQRKEIMLRLMAESMAMCLASFIVAVILAFVFAPLVGHMLDTEIDVTALFRPLNLLTAVVVVLAVGAVSGIIPAITLSRAKPIDVVKGTFSFRTRMVLSRFFITFQSFATIVLVASVMIMMWQIHHMVTAPLGYNHDNLMSIVIAPDSTKGATFKTELLKLPEVKGVSLTYGSPLYGGWNNIVTLNGKQIIVQQLGGDKDYIKVLGLKIDKDYHTGQKSGMYINRQYMSDFGLRPGQTSFRPFLNDNNDDPTVLPVLGIIKDIQLGSITTHNYDGCPVVLYVDYKLFGNPYYTALIKFSGSPAEAFSKVGDVFHSVYKEKLVQERPFVDQQIQNYYEKEVRISNTVALFAIMAIVISIMGLVAMSTYFISQRARETAIRKVFGSTGLQVRMRLIRTFMTYVVIAFVIAVPVVWYFMSDWITQYSYRISIWPSIIISGVLCFLISLAAVYMQCRNASNENPVQRLKDNG